MITVLFVIILFLVTALILVVIKNAGAEKRAAQYHSEVAAARKAVQAAKEHFEAEAMRIQVDAQTAVSKAQQHAKDEAMRAQSEAQAALARAQQHVDQQLAELARESDRVRQHYETQTRRIQVESDTAVWEIMKELEPLRKYAEFQNAEEEMKRMLSEVLKETRGLRAEANTLVDQAKREAESERAAAIEKAKGIHEQADARLNQALRDAGRIIAEAEKRAKEIGGEAYEALQDKQGLEQAAQAMRNIIEGYGDRYLVPTHSLLDDLAAEYGYDAAGQSLASAREQSRRMVEQGQAASCEYVEAVRRNTAIQFVVHAFNGSVDATLTRVKSDNYGTLEQKIRDCFSIVNRDGSAFRNARILPAYLDARLAELKWAVIVQELAQRDREEQRYLKEQERDRQRAEMERLKKLREAEREKELIEAAMAEAEKRFATVSAEQRAAAEKEVQDLRQQLEDATTRELTIAQQTNKGRIYVISNVGSFGDGVYKIGLTRRAASERVDELNSASVPFEFDIHAVIETDHAPDLEFKIHKQFIPQRINKINLRKEFFRVTLHDIRRAVESLEKGKDFIGDVIWTEKSRAQQYNESLHIEHDRDAREKWLQRTRQMAERRKRAVPQAMPSDEFVYEAIAGTDVPPVMVPSSVLTSNSPVESQKV